MESKLTFSVEKIELLDEINNSQLQKVELHAFADGNNTHRLPVSEETLRRCAYTIYDKPLVWIFDRKTNDIGNHDANEVPCGFVPRHDNEIRFEKSIDGRTFIVINAFIWKKYSQDILSYFERDGNSKPVSVELAVLDKKDLPNGDTEILDFCFYAITILGSNVRPAIPMAKAEIMEFSKIREEYEMKFSAKEQITIDNNKESAVNGNWSNPSGKLYNPTINASNKESLVNEAYLIHEVNWEEAPSTKLKYPHHVIKDGKLVLHIRGVEASFSRLRQQGISGEALTHIKRHYEELGLSKENFNLFGLSKEGFDYLFNEFEKTVKKEDITMAFKKKPETFAKLVECCGGQKFAKEENEVQKYTALGFCDKFCYCMDNETAKLSAIPYSEKEDGEVEADFCNGKFAALKFTSVDDEEEMSEMAEDAKAFCVAMGMSFTTDANQEGKAQIARSKKETEDEKETIDENEFAKEADDKSADMSADTKSDEEDMAETADEEKKEDPKEEKSETEDEEKKEDQKEKMSEEFAKLEIEVKELNEKISNFQAENEQLREFKANILELERNSQIEAVISEVIETMPANKITEWREKVVEFESVDAWKNALKADAFNYVKDSGVKENFNRMGLPYGTETKKKSNSIWDF